jgi:hypothetical protein
MELIVFICFVSFDEHCELSVSLRKRCRVENGLLTKLAGWRAIGSGATSSWYRSFPASAGWTVSEVLHAPVPNAAVARPPYIGGRF